MNQIKSKSLKKFILKFYFKISYKVWILHFTPSNIKMVYFWKSKKLGCLFLYYFCISASKL